MPENEWTPRDVAELLEEAARTLRRLPPVTVRGFFSAWPPVIRDFWEAFGWNAAEVRPGPPTSDAIDRMDEALRWLLCLEPDEVQPSSPRRCVEVRQVIDVTRARATCL